MFRVVSVDLNSTLPEISADVAVVMYVSAITFFQNDIRLRIVILKLLDKVLDFHFFFLPALIHASVRALHFFSS